VQQQERVYFFDEAVYSSSTLSKRVWAPSGEQRPSLEASRYKFTAVAAASAINASGKVVVSRLYNKAVNLANFLEYLGAFRQATLPGHVYFCLDNLPVHHCKAVK
jgi:hypothetical protein